ncbi:hypothetical protein QJS10_CPB15g01693 [Acorus calamus]|uniref:MYND-type domain-containing protein n=1 Tax=Acorus calamus TaxID=4465 RepID=A0AAV9D5D8_ACOCL|nr:hypothetical protein QJS10_CPB15g01693 [Acorus calamus]
MMMMMMECAARGRAKTPCAVGSGPPSRRCARCEAVVYCSLSHQISHWKDHKEECGRLEQQMRHSDVLNDFPFTYPIKASSQGFVRQGSLCSFLSSIALHHVGLWKPECHCGQSIPHHEYSRMYAEWNLTSSLCPCSEPREQISTHLTSWKDYYQWRCLPFHSPVALLLHWPLTLFHMVQLASTKKLSSEVRDKLHIHYLGPEKELMQLAVFGELRALFPNLQVHIDFIGPSIPQFRNGEKINIHSLLAVQMRLVHVDV